MGCSFFQRSSLACAAIIVSTMVQPTLAQRRQTADAYGMAHALLKAFYPSLLHQQFFFAIIGDDGVVPFDGLASPLLHFTVAVIKLPEAGDPESRRREILSGHIDFDFDNEMTGWNVRDTDFVSADRRRRLEVQVQGKGLSDAQVAAMLGEAGVKYGFDSEHDVSELIRPLLTRLEPFIGKARILETEFRPTQFLAWKVYVRAQKDNGAFDYNFSVEPFEGKLTGIYRGLR